jgi:hypothetical protein
MGINVQRVHNYKLSEILTIAFVTIVSLLRTGWQGVMGMDVANHLPAVLRILDLTNLDNDWYAVTTSQTQVHYFYAQIFRIIDWNPTVGTLIFFALFIGTLVLRVLVIHSIIKHFGGASWWLIAVLIVNLLPKFHVYGFIISIDPGLTPRTISWTLALVAFRYLIKRKFTRFAIFIGLGCIFQPSDGLLNALLLNVVLIATYHSELNLKKLLKLLILELSSGVWFSVYVTSLILKTQNQVVEQDYLAWTYIYFRAPYLIISNFVLLIFIVIASFVVTLGTKYRIEKILLATVLSSFGYVCLFALGVNTLNLRLIELYGVRALGFFFLSSTIASCFIVDKYLKYLEVDKILTSLNSLIVCGLAVVSLSFLFVIDPPESIIAEIKGIDFQKASLSALEYPCNLPSDYCDKGVPENTDAASLIPFVFRNNFVSFKQVGVGGVNLAEWVYRINNLTESELRREYLRQRNTGRFTPYKLHERKILDRD